MLKSLAVLDLGEGVGGRLRIALLKCAATADSAHTNANNESTLISESDIKALGKANLAHALAAVSLLDKFREFAATNNLEKVLGRVAVDKLLGNADVAVAMAVATRQTTRMALDDIARQLVANTEKALSDKDVKRKLKHLSLIHI